MAFSLDLTLLNLDVKITSFGTCIAILNVHRIFLVRIKAVPVWADLYPWLVCEWSRRWHVL